MESRPKFATQEVGLRTQPRIKPARSTQGTPDERAGREVPKDGTRGHAWSRNNRARCGWGTAPESLFVATRRKRESNADVIYIGIGDDKTLIPGGQNKSGEPVKSEKPS